MVNRQKLENILRMARRLLEDNKENRYMILKNNILN